MSSLNNVVVFNIGKCAIQTRRDGTNLKFQLPWKLRQENDDFKASLRNTAKIARSCPKEEGKGVGRNEMSCDS